jgi:hypothetical protein
LGSFKCPPGSFVRLCKAKIIIRKLLKYELLQTSQD